jgi:hypothetical protein
MHNRSVLGIITPVLTLTDTRGPGKVLNLTD